MGFTYKSYNFVDKDPMIDEIRTIVEKSGASYKWVNEESGVSTQTIAKWFDGSTRRPQAATMNAVLRSLGYKLGVVEDHKVVVPITGRMQPAVAERNSARHVVQMNKYKRSGGR
jgi:signal recognition particle subunit SEC65